MSRSPRFLDTGLDFSSDTFSAEEKASALAWYREVHDYGDLDLSPFARFMVEHDPTGFKALRRHVLTFQGGPGRTTLPVAAGILLYLYTYVAIGNGKGALYEIIAARAAGASRAEIIETIHLAALVAGPLGLNPLGELAYDYLLDWPADDDAGSRIDWPVGWAPDVEQFRSGIDLVTDGLAPGELDLIRAWHLRMYGDVPRHVDFAARADPIAYKTQQARMEKAVTGALPAQMIPLLLLNLSAIRLWAKPVRRSIQMAKTLGVRREYVVSALFWAAVYGGDVVMESAMDAAGDILEGYGG